MTHPSFVRFTSASVLLVTLALASCAQQPVQPAAPSAKTDAALPNSPYDGVDRSWVARDNGLNGITAQALGSGENQLSAMGWTAATNGWGPIERNKSNGEMGAGDGNTLTHGGKTYSTGLGMHSNASATFALNGQCSTFTSEIGVDHEVSTKGSVVFQVFGDGVKLYDSGVMTGASASKTISVSVAGRKELKLVVTNGGDNYYYDHADWGNARVQGCTATSGGISTPAPSPGSITYKGPLVITKGGTYTGNYQSTDPKVPAISIQTREPVIIENANLKGPSNLIAGFWMNLTVRNTRGYGVNPNISGAVTGRFVSSEDTVNLRLENNYLEGTAGIYVRAFKGDATKGHTIKVLRNKVKNIDGRRSNGAGGYQNARSYVQFVQFNDVKNVPNVEIAWNEVINEPYKSSLEENINMYGSSGTSASRIKIHNNFIKGAYAIYPDTDSVYSGGGILLGDGDITSMAVAPGYVDVYDNTIISTSNQGIGIAGGHNHNVYNNRVLSSGLLPDGKKVVAQNVGIYVWDNNKAIGYGTWFNNTVHDNLIGWMRVRSDNTTYFNNTWFNPCTSLCFNNSSWGSTVTLGTEQDEYNRWVSKTQSSGVKVGAN